MKTVRVFIVDDSPFVIEVIKDLLSEDPQIQIVGEALNGKQAVETIPKIHPDIVTMDIEMPVMNGLEAIEEIMAFHPVPILVITSKTDSITAYQAISKGALEVMPKPELDSYDSKALIQKIKFLSKVKVISHIRSCFTIPPTIKNTIKKNTDDRIIAIVASTGGPKALSILLSELPQQFPYPIVVAQHIADGFVEGMIKWLQKETKLRVKIGEQRERIVPGTVYFSLSEKHMEINFDKTISYRERDPKDIYFPSCNVLLSSVAKVYGDRSIGVVLTGMGDDGKIGIAQIKKAGGITIAQDERSSLIFGMPKAAIETKCIDKVLPLNEISNFLIQLIT